MPNLSEYDTEIAIELQNRIDAGGILPADKQAWLDNYNEKARHDSIFDTVEDGYRI